MNCGAGRAAFLTPAPTLYTVGMAATDPIGPTDFPTLREAARRLGCRPKVLRDARDRGELTAYRIGDRWQRLSWQDVLTWLRSKRVRPTAHAAARLREVLERDALGVAREQSTKPGGTAPTKAAPAP